jgi:predicted PurR-regulated permease PerM
MNDAEVERESFRRRALLLLVVGVSIAFLLLIRPFWSTLLIASITAGLASPLYHRLEALLKGRSALAAGLTVLAVVLLVIGPLGTVLGLVVAQAIEVSESVRPWIERQIQQPDALLGLPARAQEWIASLPFGDRLAPVLPSGAEVASKIGEFVSGVGAILGKGLASFTRGTANFVLQLFVFLYTLFFFLLGGREILDRILYYLPLTSADENELVDRFVSVTRATLKGSLVIGLMQGGLAGIAFEVAGLHAAAFWGTVMVVLSVIPGVGAALIWVPAVIWLFVQGATGAAIGLGIWCAVVVGTIDNFLRPRLVGRDAKMSDLMILLSTLGGLALFGPLGFVLGPVVAALFVTIWELYGHAFRDLLPPVERD